MKIVDPMPLLSLLVVRKTGDGADTFAAGTATLISPSLALTALHVLCDVAPGQRVPAAREMGVVRVRLVENGKEKYCEARLVWPRPGEPALAGRGDIALLALDNRLIPDDLVPLPEINVTTFLGIRDRTAAQEDYGRLTLGIDDEAALQTEKTWTFVGFPAIAARLYGKTLKALGQGPELATQLPRNATVATLTPDQSQGYIFAESVSVELARAPEAPEGAANPLGGTSGAALYKLYAKEGVNRAFLVGVASRAMHAEIGGLDRLSFTPIPKKSDAPGFWSLVRQDDYVIKGPFRKAYDQHRFLARHDEVKHYYLNYRPNAETMAPRAYVFAFACARRDEPTSLFERLQSESCSPRPPHDQPLLDRRAMIDPSPERKLSLDDGEDAWMAALRDFASEIKADVSAPPEANNSVARRLAMCRAPRVLAFKIDPYEAFDDDRKPTAWVRGTLNALLESVSTWAQFPAEPPSGSRFDRANPIVVLLGFVDDSETPDGGRFVEPAKKLLSEELTRPVNLHVAFLPKSLGKIKGKDFLDWYALDVDADDRDNNVKKIQNRIPGFANRDDQCFNQKIKEAISNLLYG